MSRRQAKRNLHMNDALFSLLDKVWDQAKGRPENITTQSRAELARRLLAQALVDYAREIGAMRDE
jgi:hypothetical protein